MSRPNRTLFALVTITTGLICASTANASAPLAYLGPTTSEARSATPAASTDDPNFAPYPGRYEVARIKGTTPDEQPVHLDVTGTADMQDQIDSISDLLSKGPVPDGGLQWDADRKEVIVRLVGPVDGTSLAVEAVRASVLAAAKGLIAKGFTAEFRSVKYSRAELEQLASRLFSTMDQWAPGLTRASGGWDPDENRVVVLIPEDTAQAWSDRVRALNDDRITTRTYTPDPARRRESGGVVRQPQAPAQSRISDTSPWAGGDWLSDDPYLTANTTNSDCTGGFNWRKWGTNARYGSTANHCEEGRKYWWHNKFPFGQVTPGLAFTSPASDTLLMSWPSSGSDFTSLVFVGDQATTYARLVRGLKSSWKPGDVVALSASGSGLHSAKVKIPNFYDGAWNMTVVLMDRHISTGGDSGGPWLTTMSANSPYPGDVIAHGQHVGNGPASPPGYDGSEFIPVNYISQKLSASLLVN